MALVEDPRGEPEGLDVGGPAIDRVDAAVAGDPADDRPVEQLALAEPLEPPADAGMSDEPSTGTSRLEAWFAAMITGPVRGISSTAPSTRTRVNPARPARTAPAIADIHGAISSPIGVVGRSSLVAHRRRRRRVESRLGIADGPDHGRDGLLERVAVRRDDPRVRGDPQRGHRSRAIEPVAPAQRLEDRQALGRAGRGRAPRPAPGPLLDRRVEVELQVGVGQDDRADVAAGHDDAAVVGQLALPAEQRRADLGDGRDG